MFKRILLAIDLAHPETQHRVAETAARMAKQDGAELRVLTVVPDFGMSIVGSYFPPGFEGEAMTKAKADLEAFADKEVGSDLVTDHIVSHGTIYREIIDAADKSNSDLIVIAAHRPELRDYLLGPNAARVVRHAKQSVLVVRE
jgi:nucleotide-binding universal stress UspA family protein